MIRRAVMASVPALMLVACGGPAPSEPSADPAAADAAPVAVTAPTAAMGEQVFKRCMACHTVKPGGTNGVGPNLHGVVGRAVASVSGFSYSPAMKAKGGVWDETALDAYLKAPMQAVRGTKMAFAGVPDDNDRKALLMYLAAQK